MGVCLYYSWTAPPLQTALCKNLKSISGIDYNQLQPELEAKGHKQTWEHNIWKKCNDQKSFEFWFKDLDQKSENNHLLHYWPSCWAAGPTTQNSISKICPKFQVLIFTFWGQWLQRFAESAQWTFCKNSVKRKYFNSNPSYVQCNYTCWSKVCGE